MLCLAIVCVILVYTCPVLVYFGVGRRDCHRQAYVAARRDPYIWFEYREGPGKAKETEG